MLESSRRYRISSAAVSNSEHAKPIFEIFCEMFGKLLGIKSTRNKDGSIVCVETWLHAWSPAPVLDTDGSSAIETLSFNKEEDGHVFPHQREFSVQVWNSFVSSEVFKGSFSYLHFFFIFFSRFIPSLTFVLLLRMTAPPSPWNKY